MNLLFPTLSRKNLKRLVLPCLAGALLAMIYGVLNDQLTYTVSDEYFTKLKYKQFPYLQVSANHRLNVVLIGLMGSWWVGVACGWFIGRWHLLPGFCKNLRQKIFRSYLIIFLTTLVFSISAYLIGFIHGESLALARITQIAEQLELIDPLAFARVSLIQTSVYAGVFIGLILSLILVKRDSQTEQID